MPSRWLFRQKILDWQIWIDAERTTRCGTQLVITFKRQADQPQYIALRIHRWEVNPKLSDDLFQFQPPEGVRKVDFLNRHAELPPLKKAADNK